MMTPGGRRRIDPDDDSIVAANFPVRSTTNGTGSDDDDDDATTVFEQSRSSSNSIRRTTPPRANNVISADDDVPLMGVMKMSTSGHLGAFVGGKPLSDWSGLDPSSTPATTPNKYRGDPHKDAKSYYYRTKGLDTKITPKTDLRETCRNVCDHLETFGLDTISYLPDPANPTVMESVAEKPNIFSKTYAITQIPIYTALWDRYDKENDEAATKFFLASLNDELLRKVRDALATTRKPTFILTWMTFIEKIRVISVGRVDGLQKLVESRVPSQYPGQNLETMAAANIRDIIDLEQAGWYNLSTGNTMVRNFASANSECRSFSWFAQSFLSRYEQAVTHCFHMNKNECKRYMDDNDFGYEDICNTFADYYRKANQDGLWLPTKNVRDTGTPKNFANQAKLQQNASPKQVDKSKSTCHNCNQVGHWAKDCPQPKSSKSNATGKSKSAKKGGSTSTPWTKVEPTSGQPQSKEMHGKMFHWCATCKRWTQSHKTSEHKSKESIAPATTSNQSSTNVSLLATSTNFAAWHVNIDHARNDFKEKENAWLNLISTFISSFILQPIILMLYFIIGIGISTVACVSMAHLTTVLEYGIIAPISWIATMLLFVYLHPIASYVAPEPPPPPLPRWKKRKIKTWLKKTMKEHVRNTTARPDVGTFHRSYPLRHRSNNNYYPRSDLFKRRADDMHRFHLFNKLNNMKWKAVDMHREIVKLKSQVKYLVQQRDASKLYCPTPFEREKLTRAQKDEKVRKELYKIRSEYDHIRTLIDAKPQSYIATTNDDAPKSDTLMNRIITYFSPLISVNLAQDPKPKTVIWDSGSSMSITSDRSEFMPGEYESLPPDRTITGISKSKVKIQGVGMVKWTFVDEKGKLRTLELPCLHVPSINQRLLSTSSLLKQYPDEQVSISNGKFVLSGSKKNKTNGIEAYIDANNNLPTSQLCDPQVEALLTKEMQSCITVVSEANQNLTEPEKELLKWHQRLAHIDCNKVKFLFRTGVLARSEASRSLQTAAAKLKHNPRCAACQFGKQCQRSAPTITQAKVADSVGALSKDVVRPGQQICIDHFICKNKGRLFTSRGKTDSSDMYGGGCLFVDTYSGFVHVELQKHMNTIETLEAKERFETMAADYGVIPQTYLSDNHGAFTSHEYTKKLKEFEQVTKFAAAGSHHHNGTAERNIRTIISIARTMMMHSAMHWYKMSDVELWPMAVKHAVHVFNRVPCVESGICPLDKFTRQRFEQSKLHDLHVWGCPVYVLDKRTSDGIKIPKWEPRSQRFVYMGTSDKHSSTVPLVLNPNTGVISPQFSVVVDEWFATVTQSKDEFPDFNKEEWTKMFGENVHHYLWDEEDDEQEEVAPLPTPQLEQLNRRERRISNAMDRERPPVPLPVPDPPTTAPTTPFRTPTRNRFEPLSTYDDENLVPTVVINRDAPPPTPDDNFVPFNSPEQREPEQRELPAIQEEEVVSVPIHQEVVAPPVNLPEAPVPSIPTPNLRRSTRTRRAPDRLNLYLESPSCFLINEPHGVSSVSEDAFTYLLSALCETLPRVSQAASLISSDAFKAALNDPDTLSWDQAINDTAHLDEWMAAALKEISSLEKHGTWEIDDQANATTKILPGTWVFRVKRAPDGSIIKFKARYCVRGDLQVEQDETYAPVVSWSTIRLFLILSLLLHWNTKSIDFSQAFVQALLKKPVWIHLPRGFHTNEGQKKCLKLVKSLYGLAEAPRLWYLHLFDALINKLGFTQSKLDACLLMKDGIMIVVFVDDCAISYRSESDYTKLIQDLRNLSFELTEEGEFSKFLGINFAYKNNTIHMTQTGLIDRIASATGLTDSNPNHTPTSQESLGKDLDGPPMTDTWSYRSIVGMLLYLSTNTRPDIAYAVSQVARFSNNPKQSHAKAIKTIVRYLVGTRDKGTFVTPTGKLDLKLFVDADFAGLFKVEHEKDPDSARSRTGYILVLGGFPLIWKSQLQTKIALSTLEAEYSALSASLRALIPIRELLFEIARIVNLPASLITTIRSTVFEDNQGAYLLASTQRISARTRYFTVEFHHFWEYIKLEDEDKRKIFLEKIDTKEQGADFLTKGQVRIIYTYNRFLVLGW